MCGITGFWAERRADERVAERMASRMAARGPDGAGG